MSEKFKDKYRIKSSRLLRWDYRSDGAYFVTLCTKERECFFGSIANDVLELSEIGIIAKKYWEEIPMHFDNVILDVFVVMPNHIHGIIVIDGGGVGWGRRDEAMPRLYNDMARISPKPGSLSVIIGSYKSICSKNIRLKCDGNFAWQSRFYDHIIRDEESLNRIREYIINNPSKWELDRNNAANLYI